jgi:hypothetical protein
METNATLFLFYFLVILEFVISLEGYPVFNHHKSYLHY